MAVIDSPLGIVLNVPGGGGLGVGEIKIGSENATVPFVHGDILLEILSDIIDQLNIQVKCGSSTGDFIDLTSAKSARKKLKELLSQKYFMEFNPKP